MWVCRADIAKDRASKTFKKAEAPSQLASEQSGLSNVRSILLRQFQARTAQLKEIEQQSCEQLLQDAPESDGRFSLRENEF